MSTIEETERRQSVPIIYTKGTHYEIGFDIGRTFASLINSFLNKSKCLNKEYIPAYQTSLGQELYKQTLNVVKKSFPQYIRELEGTADGAEVPFYKLFLLHMDDLITNVVNQTGISEPTGCTTICINHPGNEILGHTEDAPSEVLNHYYLVSAHIVSETPQGKWGIREEQFTSLCYAGQLPGCTMSYNHHGLIFSLNAIGPKKLHAGKVPIPFLARALLCAENMEQAENILQDKGCGAAGGCSVNMTFLLQEGDRLFHNIEVAPTEDNESDINVFTASPGEQIIHCNKYLRLSVEEDEVRLKSSKIRMNTLRRYPVPIRKENVIQMLSDETGAEFCVFRDKEFGVTTIAVGVFDCVEQTWSIYSDSPMKSKKPLIVLPLVLKNLQT